MRKQTIRAASALALIFSIGFASSLKAAPSPSNRQPSANCQQAWETADSLLMNVPKALCLAEDTYEAAINKFMKETDSSTNVNAPAPSKKKQSKFPRGLQAERPRSTKPKRTAKANGSKAHGWRKNHGASHHRTHGKSLAHHKARTAKPKHPPARQVHRAVVIGNLYLGANLRQLSPDQRKEVRHILESLLNRKVSIAFLNAVERSEGGGPLVVVGGLRGKSADCQRRIRKLNFSGHPKEQGLPNRCFLTTKKYGLSTASGSWQIVYYRNWRALRKLLDLKDFSEKSQAVAALELVRSSAVPGGKVGEGLVALFKGDLDRAIRKGTDPWASSPYSRWRGKRPAPLLQYAQKEMRKLNNEKNVRTELKKFGQNNNV